MLLNEIINISHHRGDDYFREIFSNPIINWTIILIWLLGLVSCVFLRIVSWFEKTGQAGPFRTLVNRLFSCIIDQVGSPYLLFQRYNRNLRIFKDSVVISNPDFLHSIKVILSQNGFMKSSIFQTMTRQF